MAAVGLVGADSSSALAAAGCLRPDMYAQHTLDPAEAVGGAAVAGAKFGAAVVSGDFNGDDKADVAVGAPSDAVGGVAAGSVSVFVGTADGVGGGKRLVQADAGAASEAGDQWGASLATGDFDRDGFDDLAIGAPGEMVGTAKSGGISVFLGSASGLTTGRGFTQVTGDGGNEAGDLFGRALASADFNADGFADLAIGTPGEVPGGETAKGGTVYVFKGSASSLGAGWPVNQEDADGATEADDEFGASLAAGNVTGSANADLVVGAPGEAPGTAPADSGALYVVPGAAAGKSAGFARWQTHAGGASEAGDTFAEALAVGNFDKDAYADIAVGVPGEAPGTAPAAGSLMVLPGSASATGSPEGFSVQESGGGEAITAGDRFGASLAARDANADGFADLLVGAPRKSYGSVTAAGVGFLFNGGPRAADSTLSMRLGRRIAQSDLAMDNETNDAFGSAVTFGDITGDGKPEAMIGGSGEAESGPAAGAATVLTNLALGVAPSVPLESFTPTAAMQATPLATGGTGSLEYAYANNVGQLLHGHQTNPADFNTLQWTVISGAAPFAGTPGLAEQQDGRLQVAGHNTSSNVWVNTQATKDPAAWGDWVNTGGRLASHTAIIRDGDTLVVFAVDGDGTLWALQQTSPNVTHTSWMSMGVTGLTGTPVAVKSSSGIRVFARDTTGDIKSFRYADRNVSGCVSLNGAGFTGTPAVVPVTGDTMWVFARAADGSIQTQHSDVNGVFDGTWATIGSFTLAGSPAALLSPSSSKLELVARGDDGVIYSTGETLQGSGEWRPWVRAIPDEDPSIAATDPTVFSYTAGGASTWSYLFRTSDNVTRLYTTGPGGPSAPVSDDAPPVFEGHTLPAPPPE